jgi:hypothetical protein
MEENRRSSKPMSLHRFRAPISTILLSSGLQPGGRDAVNLRWSSAAGGCWRRDVGDLVAWVLAAQAGAR